MWFISTVPSNCILINSIIIIIIKAEIAKLSAVEEQSLSIDLTFGQSLMTLAGLLEEMLKRERIRGVYRNKVGNVYIQRPRKRAPPLPLSKKALSLSV